MKNCCYKCQEREIGCHAHCGKYREFQKRNEEIRKKKRLDHENNDGWQFIKKRKKNG